MRNAIILQHRVRRDIQTRTEKILRELGNPPPPLKLEDVRELLRLDCAYFTSEHDGLLQRIASKLRRGGKQILRRPTFLIDAIKKFDLRALYLPDEKSILIDDTVPQPKHRWLEAHEIGHDLLPWHHEMLLGDDDMTPTASTHSKMEAEANFAAGALLFLGDNFREDCRQTGASISSAQSLKKRYGNTMTTTFWRMIEYMGEDKAIIGTIGHHPKQIDVSPSFRHIIPSSEFDKNFTIPNPDDLINAIRQYCFKNKGPLGSGEIIIKDRSGSRHTFDFETFYNGYDALTLGVHRCETPFQISI